MGVDARGFPGGLLNYELGFINKSYFHHIKCKELYPDNKCVISNDEIFNKLINREG